MLRDTATALQAFSLYRPGLLRGVHHSVSCRILTGDIARQLLPEVLVPVFWIFNDREWRAGSLLLISLWQGVEATLFATLMSILNGGSFAGSALGSGLTAAFGVTATNFTLLAPLIAVASPLPEPSACISGTMHAQAAPCLELSRFCIQGACGLERAST